MINEQCENRGQLPMALPSFFALGAKNLLATGRIFVKISNIKYVVKK
jgi:hypothetical protein